MTNITDRGMTLVELLVVIVVAGILATIAVPSYRNYVIRAQRTEATAALLQVQSAQEKYYLQYNAYAGQIEALPPAGLGLRSLTENGKYTIGLLPPPQGGQSFIAVATPVANSGQDKDRQCAEFRLDDKGRRTATPAGAQLCWR